MCPSAGQGGHKFTRKRYLMFVTCVCRKTDIRHTHRFTLVNTFTFVRAFDVCGGVHRTLKLEGWANRALRDANISCYHCYFIAAHTTNTTQKKQAASVKSGVGGSESGTPPICRRCRRGPLFRYKTSDASCARYRSGCTTSFRRRWAPDRGIL